MINNYKKLEVWDKGQELVVSVYQLTRKLPKDERFGLVSQMRRCAVSIPSNIAEGKMRSSDTEFRRFLLIALGSGAELETQIDLSKKLFGLKSRDTANVEILLEEVMKMLNTFIKKLES